MTPNRVVQFLMVAVLLAGSASLATAQRTESTTPRTLERSDLVYADLTCTLYVRKSLPLDTSKPDLGIGSNWEAIPNGSSAFWSGTKQEVYALVYINNKGYRRAVFQTQVRANKPPQTWVFSYASGQGVVSTPVLTFESTLEAGARVELGSMYIKPITGRQTFVIEVKTDGPAAVTESNENNNVCRHEFTMIAP